MCYTNQFEHFMYTSTKIILELIVIFSLVTPAAANAARTDFPSCTNPGGALQAQYDSGTHGIPGSSARTGSDAVYTIDSNRVLQCFCSTAGVGIQTNWLKASSLTAAEIANLKSHGWLLVPTGAVWGLDNDPYLALNSRYACRGGVGGAVLGESTDPTFARLPATGANQFGNILLAATIAVAIGLFTYARRQKTAK